MRYFWLHNATIHLGPGQILDPPPSSLKKPHHRKKAATGERNFKVDTLRVWTYDPVDDNSLVLVDDMSSPYAVEVEAKAKVKKPKMKLLKLEKETTSSVGSTYDPLMHVKEISHGSSLGSGSLKGQDKKQDFLAPMPYNEKLRRGGKENAKVIAETQLSTLEVIKQRYRKAATEYPVVRIQDHVKVNNDLYVVDGKKINSRKYKTLLSHQDRVLADMAARAGGSLALTPHNIIVLPTKRTGPGTIRECYSTRRKERIEVASFDISKSFSRVPKPVKSMVINTSSSSEESGPEEDTEVFNEDLDLFKIHKKSPLKLKKGCSRSTKSKLADGSPVSSDNSSGTTASSVETQDWSLKERKLSQMKEEYILESLREMSLPKDKASWEKREALKQESRSNSLEKKYIKTKIEEDFSLFNQTQTL